MFKKLINRQEDTQVKISDSALSDIIPSDDVILTKKSQQKRCLNICKVLIFIFILGLIAIGIVLLALILTYSGKSFMSFILHSSATQLLSNKTLHQQNFTESSHKQDWQKIAVLPTSTHYSTQSTVKTILTSILNRQSTNIPFTTIKDRDYTLISSEKKIITSTFVIPKIRTYEITTSKNLLTSKSLMNKNTKQTTFNRYKTIDDNDNILDDLLFS
ncbi:unnamed protein product [Adineta steineri]|uniref:Uncharacterized protein n=1 Tax=Adineta steineri TaxID=433720 RepID=A0A815D1J4_9BILA|nr:unnamed protein product [Adineta steineri]